MTKAKGILRWIDDWLARHRSPVSFWLHMIGIPLTIVGVILGLYQLLQDPPPWERWWHPVLLFVSGYFLQWCGHLHEGNDMGEIIVVKRLLGLPYNAISQRYANRPSRQRT